MIDVRINITIDGLDSLTWEQFEQIEKGPNVAQAREICALFVVDENGAPMTYKDAFAHLGKLKGPQIKAVTSAFMDKIRELQATAVPPQSS